MTLSCNYRNCNIGIVETSWVTKCGHIFCPAHGKYIKRLWAEKSCPACGTHFANEEAIFQTTVNPSSSIFLGSSPDVVLKIAQDCITFWNYQISQKQNMFKKQKDFYKEQMRKTQEDCRHLKNLCKKLENKAKCLELQLKTNLAKRHQEILEREYYNNQIH